MGKFCTHCGKELEEVAVYCMGCGFKVHEQRPTTVRQNSSSNNIVINIIGLVLGIIGFLYSVLSLAALEDGIDMIGEYSEVTEIFGYAIGFILIQGLFTLISVVINNTVKKDENNKNIVNATFVLNVIALCIIVLEAVVLLFGY